MNRSAEAPYQDQLLDEAEAAQYLKLSVRTLQAWRNRRIGPSFVRVGRVIRYRGDDLVRWLVANTVSFSDGKPSLKHDIALNERGRRS